MTVFLWLGFDPLRMIRGGVTQWSPPSLTTFVGAVPAAYAALRDHAWINHVAVGGACLFACILFGMDVRRATSGTMMRSVIAVWISYLLLSPNSFPSYRLLILPFLPALVDRPGRVRVWLIVLFCCYCTALGIQWMLYEDAINKPYAAFLIDHAYDAQSVARLGVQLALDAVILGGELAWLTLCFLDRRNGRGTRVSIPSG